MKNLSGNTLYKNEKRAERFLYKLRELSPFELINGSQIILKPSEAVVNAIINKESVAKLLLYDTNNNAYRFKDLAKTSEFGGRGSGTYKEDLALDSLIAQIDAAKINNKASSIPLLINSVMYEVATAESTSGCPKSDFHLLDTSGAEVVWISHKDGSTPKSFQQWGGVSLTREPTIANHEETLQFIIDLKATYPNGIPPKTTVYRYIDDNNLKMKSVYGNGFGNNLGQQNVTILLQGNVKLDAEDDSFKLDATHVHYNGDSVDGNGYDPVLMATYKGDRSNSGVIGTRISISPIGGRNGHKF